MKLPLTDNIVDRMSVKDRKLLGLKTRQERLEKHIAKSERQLQTQIVQYLRYRGIEPLWHRTDKRSHATIGWPDITFSVMSNGFATPCAYEVKFGSGLLSPAQSDMLQRLQSAPNAWRCRVIRSFEEVVSELRELNV